MSRLALFLACLPCESGAHGIAAADNGIGWTLTLTLLLGTSAALYAVGKLLYRRYLVRHYSVPMIDPGELNAKLSSADGVLVVDLRNEEAFRRSETALVTA